MKMISVEGFLVDAGFCTIGQDGSIHCVLLKGFAMDVIH